MMNKGRQGENEDPSRSRRANTRSGGVGTRVLVLLTVEQGAAR
jgi:hypothetical protein